MSQRTRALIALVASAALLLGSGIAFAMARSSGVGTEIDLASQPTASVLATPSPAAGAEPTPAAASRGADRESTTAATQPAQPPAVPPGVTEETARVDATQIVIPDDPEPPRQIRIDSIGLDVPVLATGVQGDGQMQIPDDVEEMGWYKFGAAPGDETGSAVIAGHVDSFEYGIGPLARLPQVAVGDTITVDGPGDGAHRYEVVDVTRYVKADLPTQEIFDPEVSHRLVVITCGGRYVGGTIGYEDNIVVIAEPRDA